MADRLGGDYRFFRIMEAIAKGHEVSLLSYAVPAQLERYGRAAVDGYRSALSRIGIEIVQPGVRAALRATWYDAVIFQYHPSAALWLKEVRAFQPGVPIVIDNGDVVYRRFESKARVTQAPDDFRFAKAMKEEELACYRAADAILGVSEEDVSTVHAEIPDLRVFMVPTIHPIPAPPARQRVKGRLLFIGSFLHHPNVDGIVWFVSKVFPLIAASIPGARLQIVGNAPTEEVKALASPQVEVVGFVPETAPYLEAADVSVAPLRFGAGVKSKIGEAMSYRLPVVTTSIGAEGFGVRAGEEILVGDSPAEFAAQVVRLLADEQLRESVAQAGFRFLDARFSEAAVRDRISEFLAALPGLQAKGIGLRERLLVHLDDWWTRNVRWRLQRAR
jgi:glycosyltransferase involved in cell wall biosynthesis